jgi:hypothetical protein
MRANTSLLDLLPPCLVLNSVFRALIVYEYDTLIALCLKILGLV